MAEQTMTRISKKSRDLAEVLAQGYIRVHADSLPIGTYSVSQGDIIERALEEYGKNHPDYLPVDK